MSYADFFNVKNLSKLQNRVISRQQSSYDRTGKNSDAFGWGSGTKTLLSVSTPGAVTRMWFTGNAGAGLKFYFDGEKEPRINTTVAKITAGTNVPLLCTGF